MSWAADRKYSNQTFAEMSGEAKLCAAASNILNLFYTLKGAFLQTTDGRERIKTNVIDFCNAEGIPKEAVDSAGNT